MFLKTLSLQNFRNYKKSKLNFNQDLTFIVGPNTSGKTNLIEAVHFLAYGESLKNDRDSDPISFGETFARVNGQVEDTDLEVLITEKSKKYLVNGVSKRRADFMNNFAAVAFLPPDLDMIVGSPGLRRRFLDSSLQGADGVYRMAFISYYKALRSRNSLLQRIKDEGFKDETQFEYWDGILIKNGRILTDIREKFIDFLNNEEKHIFDMRIFYDRSVISKERLEKYKEAERASGVTLVGPHRDDFQVFMKDKKGNDSLDVKLYASRGQQRLCVLQLKFLSLLFMEKFLGHRPVLLLDDIFSELDSGHIKLVSKEVAKQQTIITTTHREFIPDKLYTDSAVINLDIEK